MNIFTHLTNIAFRNYQKGFCRDWNEHLDKIIDNHDKATLKNGNILFVINGERIEVWCNNKFYAYGFAYKLGGVAVNKSCQFRPSLKVMKKLHNFEVKLSKDKVKLERGEFNLLMKTKT